MNASRKRRFGRMDFDVTQLGLGAAPIGNIFRPITDSDARAMIDEAWSAGVRLFDTAPMYGHGLSEHRCGSALHGRTRSEYVLSTKVGRLLKPMDPSRIDFGWWVDVPPMAIVFDYSYDGTLRSIEDSLQRLLTHRIDIALIHDIDVFTHGREGQKERFREAMNGAYKALLRLRDEGVVGAIGCGVNEWQVCEKALTEGDFDCFLLAGRYTLLEQEALDSFLPECERRGVAVILGGGFNSGILATGPVPGAKYNYTEAPSHIMERTARIKAVCDRHGVPLAAAALQFVLAHPSIPTVIPGTRSVDQLRQNVRLLDLAIPQDLWEELRSERLLSPFAPTPASRSRWDVPEAPLQLQA